MKLNRFYRMVLYLAVAILFLCFLHSFSYRIELPNFLLTKERSLYVDRNYVLEESSCPLDVATVVQLPRHLTTDVYLKSEKVLTVRRLLCEKNDNWWIDDWKKLPCSVFVKGATCELTTLVQQSFEPGLHELASGGPIAASPILIDGSPDSVELSAYYFQSIDRSQKLMWCGALFLLLLLFEVVMSIRERSSR